MKSRIMALALIFMLLLPYIVPAISSATAEPDDLSTITTEVVDVGSEQVSVTTNISNVDGEQYVQFRASVLESNIETVAITTDLYPISALAESVENTSSTESVSTTSTGLPKFDWHGITFVEHPGSDTQWVKYDHPDNYETYYPLEVNRKYNIYADRDAAHLTKDFMEDTIEANDLQLIAAGIFGVAAALAAIPEFLASKTVAAVCAIIAAAITLAQIVLHAFLTSVLQTELGDGWVYVWGAGNAINIVYWFHISLGAWYNWGWYVVITPLGAVVVPDIPYGGSAGGEIVPINTASLMAPYIASTFAVCMIFIGASKICRPKKKKLRD